MASAFLLPALTLTACAAPTHYAGIDLRAGAANAEVQALAQQAQGGSKEAQLALGIRYEEGRGVPFDVKRARKLYGMAATRTGEGRHGSGEAAGIAGKPNVGKYGSLVPVNTAPREAVLKAANERVKLFLRKENKSAPCPAIYDSDDYASAAFMVNSFAPSPFADPVEAPTAWFRYTETKTHPYKQTALEWRDLRLDKPYPVSPTSFSFSIEIPWTEINAAELRLSAGTQLHSAKHRFFSYGAIRYINFYVSEIREIVALTDSDFVDFFYKSKKGDVVQRILVTTARARYALDEVSIQYMGKFGKDPVCFFEDKQPLIIN